VPIDIYQREDQPEYKQITVRVSLASYEKTLRDAEMARLLEAVTDVATQQLTAERI
jgi:phenylalanyl-tRNA synthetase beta subunit